MKLKYCNRLIISVVIALIFSGCSSTKNIKYRSELWSPGETGTITVLTKDSTLYSLTIYSLSDSLLSGAGESKQYGLRKPFSGEIRLSDIQYIHSEEYSVLKTLVALGAVGIFSSTAISNIKGDNGLSITEQLSTYTPSGGGSSCPYIYSWNGERYILEGEAFGIAFGSALELNTACALPSLSDAHSDLKIRLSNERPETHYFNAIQLVGIETDKNTSIFLDNTDNAWPVFESIPPVQATDRFGKDIRSSICSIDKTYWESSAVQDQYESDFQDIIEVDFVRPVERTEGSILITAINTEFSQVVFKNVFEFLGDQKLAFMQAAEHDSEMVKSLRCWINESSLKATVWNGKEWQPVGAIHPQATAVPFSKIIRLNTGGILVDTIKIRFSSLADVWKIDAVQIDWTPAKPLGKTIVPLISALGPKEKDVSEAIASVDSKYSVLLPPEKIELIYRSLSPSPGKKMAYVLNTQGYLYEWFPAQPSQKSNLSNISIPASQRINYLKNLLQNKSIFLPPIYAQWAQTKLAK